MAAAMGICLLLTPAARGSIVFSMDPVAASPGDIGDGFDVLITNVGGPSVDIASFSWEIMTTDTNILFTSATTAAGVGTYIFAGGDSFADLVDSGVISIDGLDHTLPGQKILSSDLHFTPLTGTTLNDGDTFSLGRVFFDVAGGAAPGEVATLTFIPDPGSSLADSSQNANGILIDTLTPGAITIVDAVPEPGSWGLTLVGLLALGAGAARKRFQTI